MRVRIAASPEDFDAFRALADEYEEYLPPELRHSTWAAQRSLVAQAFAPPQAVFLAELDGRPVGCVVLSAPMRGDSSTEGVVKRLYVSPNARGSGAGRALMNALLGEARRRGYDRVILDTHAEQLPAAYQLYRSLGFHEREATYPVDYGCATFMELSL